MICIVVMIYFPYMSFEQSNGKIRNTNRIFEMLGNDWMIDLFSIPFWYSIILVLESTMIKKLKPMHIWLFAFQAGIIGVFTVGLLEILSFCLFCSDVELTFNYYFMGLYFIFGAIINLLIAGSISKSKKNTIIMLFDKLSLFNNK